MVTVHCLSDAVPLRPVMQLAVGLVPGTGSTVGHAACVQVTIKATKPTLKTNMIWLLLRLMTNFTCRVHQRLVCWLFQSRTLLHSQGGSGVLVAGVSTNGRTTTTVPSRNQSARGTCCLSSCSAYHFPSVTIIAGSFPVTCVVIIHASGLHGVFGGLWSHSILWCRTGGGWRWL